MSGKGRCAVCRNLYPLRLSGLVVNHMPGGSRYRCPGADLLPVDPTREPTWEARASDWETRYLDVLAVLERVRSLPVQSGGVIRVADLAEAMGDQMEAST